MKPSSRIAWAFALVGAAAFTAWVWRGGAPELRALLGLGEAPAASAAAPGGDASAGTAAGRARGAQASGTVAGGDTAAVAGGGSRADGGPGGAARGGAAGANRRGGGGPVPVALAGVEVRDVPIRLRLVGRVEAQSSVTLRSRVDGLIEAIHYAPGQRVRKGQPMVTLDARMARAQLAQAQANLARDRANLEKARSDLQRTQGLVERGFVSSAQLDAARATMRSLEATVAADRAAIDLATTQLGFTRIVAPTDGIAGTVLAHPGNVAKANDTQLVIINKIQPANVSFSLPEARLAEVPRPGPQAKGPEVIASVPGDESGPHRGRLVFMENAVDATTGTIALRAEFANRDERLTPGQFVEIALTLREIRGALVIPAEALQSGPNGAFVYVARDDGTVEARPVRAEPADARTMIALSGVAAGEKVVTDGQLRLVPGARYVVPRAAGAPGGRRAAGPTGRPPTTDPAGGAPAASPDAAGGKATGTGPTTGERS